MRQIWTIVEKMAGMTPHRSSRCGPGARQHRHGNAWSPQGGPNLTRRSGHTHTHSTAHGQTQHGSNCERLTATVRCTCSSDDAMRSPKPLALKPYGVRLSIAAVQRACVLCCLNEISCRLIDSSGRVAVTLIGVLSSSTVAYTERCGEGAAVALPAASAGARVCCVCVV